ncbi:MAG TPA: C1 family peptidase, partial [Blastocatellia bacterium]|nr:C1 family peptidase [Blastocatellia bacterium]
CGAGFQEYGLFIRNSSFSDIYGHTGAVMENDCPYRGTNWTCAGPYTHHYWISGWSYIGFPLQVAIASRDQLKRAIYLFGPISTSVYAGNWAELGSFTGVLRNHCPPDPVPAANHMVMIVGWSDALQAWRIRNSWGDKWGDNGEAWLGYECAWAGFIASYVHYPTGRGVYVDFNHTGGELGLFNLPFNTLFEGYVALDPGGTLNIKAGSSSEKLILAKAMTIRAYGGTVTIGR